MPEHETHVKRKQCKKCPWRKDVDPHDIPNGYCELKHAKLGGTIAKAGDLSGLRTLRVMACHETPIGHERPCIGWLHNQLGVGNNLGLRMRAMQDPTLCEYELRGAQHKRFEDTLPKDDE